MSSTDPRDGSGRYCIVRGRPVITDAPAPSFPRGTRDFGRKSPVAPIALTTEVEEIGFGWLTQARLEMLGRNLRDALCAEAAFRQGRAHDELQAIEFEHAGTIARPRP